MSSPSEKFYVSAMALMESARVRNLPILQAAAPIIAENISRGGVLHVFGSGHSEVIGREIIGRAGGLACVSGVMDPTAGFIENLVGYGTRLIERYDRQYQLLAGETLIAISNSGKNAAPIEVALYAKKKGLHVVALTSLAMSTTATTVHPEGRNLHAIADHVLDNGGVPGDTLIELSPSSAGQPAVLSGPTSTLVGALLLNLLMLEVIDWLRSRGHPVPLLRSQNIPGAIDYNRKVGQPYAHRLSRVLA